MGFGRRKIALAAAALMVPILLPRTMLTAQAKASPGSYYIALGDSLAYGVTTSDIPPDPTCTSSTAPGYACLVHGYLNQIQPQQLVTYAKPDMDSCWMATGTPCGGQPSPNNAPSDIPVADAVQFIKDHPGAVGSITIDVGGADLIPLLPQALVDPAGTAAKLPAIFKRYQANLDSILSQLRAAGPSIDIVLITQYNPLGGISSPPLPAGLPEIASGAIGSLDSVMTAEAHKNSVKVADVAAAFDAHPGGAALLTFVPASLAAGDSSKIDIYPTPDGYRLYGQTVLKALSFKQKVKVKAKISSKSPVAGKKVKLSGTTVSGSTVKISVSLPRGKRSKTVVADNNGSFSYSFGVGRARGSAFARACAADPVSGNSHCGSKVKLTVH